MKKTMLATLVLLLAAGMVTNVSAGVLPAGYEVGNSFALPSFDERLVFQTTGPQGDPGFGDTYRYFELSIEVPAGFDSEINFSIYDPESYETSGNILPDQFGDINNVWESMYFNISDPDGDILHEETYDPVSTTNRQWVQFHKFLPTKSGEYTLFGQAEVDDQSGFRLAITPRVDSEGRKLNITWLQASYEFLPGTPGNTVAQFVVCVPEDYTDDTFDVRNYDLDGKVSIKYVDPDGNEITGTVSGNKVWATDTLTATAGCWAINVNPSATDTQKNQWGLESDIPFSSPAPSIDIEKFTNCEDADDLTGPIVIVGKTVTWEYVVTNTGNVPLTNVVVTDDVLGEICTVAALAVGESTTCTATGIAVEGQYANTGTATGDFEGVTVSDSDPSHYFGAAPAIDIEKYTNGEDADDPVDLNNPTGPSYVVGAPIEWTYVVTNTGNVPLIDIAVTDDQGVTVTCPQTELAVGESMTCTAEGEAVVGQYKNIGIATGWYEDVKEVKACDPSHYYGIDAPGVGTPGYWKNHPDAWPVDEIEIGCVIYTKDDAIDYMNDPVKKDKTYTMFPALVSAKLNVLIGNKYCPCASCACPYGDSTNFIADADAWMAANPIGSGVEAKSPAWKEGEPLYECLDWYNNGGWFWAPHRY